jgi:hypothetical protein
VKSVNAELDAACPSLKMRLHDLDRRKALVTRAPAMLPAAPFTSEQAVSSGASQIVEESMAEAAALVHHLFEKQIQGKGMGQREQVSRAGLPATASSPTDTPAKMSLFVDDEILIHMSTKLTAMFIAIQRCATPCTPHCSHHPSS